MKGFWPRLLLILLMAFGSLSAAPAQPFRLAIVGLDHGHVDSYLAETLARAGPEKGVMLYYLPKSSIGER